MEPIPYKSGEIPAIDKADQISNINISRAFSHKQELAAKGHVFYKFSFFKGMGKKRIRYDHGVQISLAWEALNGEDKVKEYIRETYIK